MPSSAFRSCGDTRNMSVWFSRVASLRMALCVSAEPPALEDAPAAAALPEPPPGEGRI